METKAHQQTFRHPYNSPPPLPTQEQQYMFKLSPECPANRRNSA